MLGVRVRVKRQMINHLWIQINNLPAIRAEVPFRGSLIRENYNVRMVKETHRTLVLCVVEEAILHLFRRRVIEIVHSPSGDVPQDDIKRPTIR